eukprot:5684899-Alexandrium_andersonii.AAC.1
MQGSGRTLPAHSAGRAVATSSASSRSARWSGSAFSRAGHCAIQASSSAWGRVGTQRSEGRGLEGFVFVD